MPGSAMWHDTTIGLHATRGRPYILVHSHTVQWFSDEVKWTRALAAFPPTTNPVATTTWAVFIVILWYLFPASYGHAIHPSHDVLPCPVVWGHYHRPCLNIFQCTHQIVQHFPIQDNIKIVSCKIFRLNVNVSNEYIKQEPTTPTHTLYNWQRFISFEICLVLFFRPLSDIFVTKYPYNVSKFTFFSQKVLATTVKFSTKHSDVLPISLICATGPTHYVTTVKAVQYKLRIVSLGQGPVNFLRPFCASTAVSLSLYHAHKLWAQIKGVQRLPEWKRRTSGVQ